MRAQQENVIKDKISLVQGQIDSYNSMLTKLQAGADNDARRKMVGEIEGKLVSLQSQLQTLSAQRDNPALIESTVRTHPSPVRRGGRSFGGRFNTRGGRSFRGGGRFVARGRRGRGGGGVKTRWRRAQGPRESAGNHGWCCSDRPYLVPHQHHQPKIWLYHP